MATRTKWMMDCWIVFSTRNHLKVFSDQTESGVLDVMLQIADQFGTMPLVCNYGVINPVTQKTQFSDSSMRLRLQINGTDNPEKIYAAIRNDLWEQVKEANPTIKTNPFPKGCLIMDAGSYTEDTAYDYVLNHSWRRKSRE